MMRETVTSGTSHASFKTLLRNKKFKGVEIGGKTGSLHGKNPEGKCDWFVGYAISNQKKIALAVITVHENLWRVKSSYLARMAIEKYF
jgi:beta-lactamase class D